MGVEQTSDQSSTTSITTLLSKGDVTSGHRSREDARKYLPDFKKALHLPNAPEPAFDPLLEEFLIEAVLSAAWYQKRYIAAQRQVRTYIAFNAALIIAIPLALIGLGALATALKANALVGQTAGILTGILALQKTLSTWYASQRRYAVWYKAAADLKTLYYGLVQTWSGKAGTDTTGFVDALKNGTIAARAIVSDEQLDFYQKLALPSFDVLDMLTSTRSAVSTFVATLVPGSPTQVAVAGKNLIAAGPTSVPNSANSTHVGNAGSASIKLPIITVLQEGAQKDRGNPYTIVIIANPTLQPASAQDQLIADPIMQLPTAYQNCVQYIRTSLFGRLPGQAEHFLAQFETDIRIISIFDPSLEVGSTTALVANYSVDDIVQPLQEAFAPLVARYQYKDKPIIADVVFAVTASTTNDRSSSYYTADDEGSGGTNFDLDGQPFVHRQSNIAPGVVALHVSATSIVALHEFSHAASSWTNGSITDLYVDSATTYNAINVRQGRPIPPDFAQYAGKTYKSDLLRECLHSYPPGWSSYHCEEVDSRFPAVMDDFWHGPGKPEDCKHDKITLDFLTARLRSIMSRA